jgi:hypothetical protein
MRRGVLAKLRDVIPEVSSSDVFRVALWLLGQYSESDEEVQAALHSVRECLGPLPLSLPWEQFISQVRWAACHHSARIRRGHYARVSFCVFQAAATRAGGVDVAASADAAKSAAASSSTRRPVVLADGTYATQSAITSADRPSASKNSGDDYDESLLPHLRRLVLGGDFFLAAAVSSTLTKLALRVGEHHGARKLHNRTPARGTSDVFLPRVSVFLQDATLARRKQSLWTPCLPCAASWSSARQGWQALPSCCRLQHFRHHLSAVFEVALVLRPQQQSPASLAHLRYSPLQLHLLQLLAPSRPVCASTKTALSVSRCACACWETQPRPQRRCQCSCTPAETRSVRFSASRCERVFFFWLDNAFLAKTSLTLAIYLQRARSALAAKEGVVSGGASLLQLSASRSGASAAASSGPGAADPCSLAAVDDALSIRLLRPNRGVGGGDDVLLDDDSADASRAAAVASADSFSERLKRVHQLTGFADTVYCEAFVRVHEYDIVLELLLLNRTDTTMTNVTVELSTMGDLKLVERPAAFTLAPRDSRTIRANLKVSSTETGHIFGTIVYDTPGAVNAMSIVNLAEIHVDIMDYIQPATCSDSVFRSMW